MSALVLAAAPRAHAQDPLTDAVRRIGSGTVRVQFSARPGVCGNGQTMGFNSGGRIARDGAWESECDPGPVRVAMDLRDGRPVSLRYYVGGRWRGAGDATDIGTIAAAAAGPWFARLAESGAAPLATDAVVVSTLADSSVVWPVLLRIAKDGQREREIRKTAVFWLGQTVGDVTASLNGLARADDDDLEVRTSAVFALSQRPRGEGVPVLLDIARGRGDPRVWRQAIFWLGQSGDPRALAFFEEVLTRR
jgi:hypothetical protein